MDIFSGFTTSGSIQRLVDQVDDERPKADKEAREEQPRRPPREFLVDRGHRRWNSFPGNQNTRRRIDPRVTADRIFSSSAAINSPKLTP
jgi:hypothetical protein